MVVSSRHPSVSSRRRFQSLALTQAGIALGTAALFDPTVASLAIGGAMALLGAMLRIAAAGYGYKAGDMALRGPYRFVRHPYFLGTALIYLGFPTAARAPWVMGIAVVGLTYALKRLMGQDEERLEQRLGASYATYRAQVPAFVPRLWPLPCPESGAQIQKFSFRTAILTGRHREIDTLAALGIAFLIGGLVVAFGGQTWVRWVVASLVALYLAARILYSGRPDASRRLEVGR